MAIVIDAAGNSPVGNAEYHIHARNDVVSGRPETVVVGTDFSSPCRAIYATAADTITVRRRDGTDVANVHLTAGENAIDCIQVVSQAGSADMVAML